MDIILDLDGTICEELPQAQRCLAKPLSHAVSSIKKLKEQGHTIIIFSARSWSEYKMTEDWLKRHQVEYDRLILGKPIANLWIDDRAIRFKGWDKVLEKLNK